jgi:hypothetical protein
LCDGRLLITCGNGVLYSVLRVLLAKQVLYQLSYRPDQMPF